MTSHERRSFKVIAVDATAARTGGGPSRVGELVRGLPALAPEEKFLFAVAQPLLDHAPLANNVGMLAVPEPMRRLPTRLAWEHFYLPRRLHQEGVDWLLGPFNVVPLGPGLPASTRIALIISNIVPFMPEIWKRENAYQRLRNRALRELTIASIRRAQVVFVLSSWAGNLLEGVLRGRNVARLPMAPPDPSLIAALPETSPESSERPFFIVPGNLYPYKGVTDAIRATSILVEEGADVGLVVCGDPLDRRYALQLRRLAASLPQGRVVFMAGVRQPHVLGLMKRAIGTLVCSRVENMGRVPVEAMSVGCPVIGTEIEPTVEACGDAVLYYKRGDAQALAFQMKSLLNDRVRSLVACKGLERVAGMDSLSASREILETLELL